MLKLGESMCEWLPVSQLHVKEYTGEGDPSVVKHLEKSLEKALYECKSIKIHAPHTLCYAFKAEPPSSF